MLQPKKPKFRKQFKGRMHGVSKGGNFLNFGAFGLKALTPARITSRQIESARRCISRHLKRSGRVWIRIFPDVPVSKKPAEVRQGKGKGAVEFWAAKVKPGKILFEKDPDLKIFPASMTKIMTSIIAFDLIKQGQLNLDDKFFVS